MYHDNYNINNLYHFIVVCCGHEKINLPECSFRTDTFLFAITLALSPIDRTNLLMQLSEMIYITHRYWFPAACNPDQVERSLKYFELLVVSI